MIVFCWSPECLTSRPIILTKASKVWKHFALTRVGLLFCSASALKHRSTHIWVDMQKNRVIRSSVFSRPWRFICWTKMMKALVESLPAEGE